MTGETFQNNGVQALLMGGQACVFYGAAQVSTDVDFILLAERENYDRLRASLEILGARRIGVPRFDPDLLARGHAVHFRCSAPGVEDLRAALDAEVRAEQAKDRAYWEPLRRELEAFRREERQGDVGPPT